MFQRGSGTRQTILGDGDPRGPEPWRRGNGPQSTVEVLVSSEVQAVRMPDGRKVTGRRNVRAYRRAQQAEGRRVRRELARETER